jgi:hypothetical protein
MAIMMVIIAITIAAMFSSGMVVMITTVMLSLFIHQGIVLFIVKADTSRREEYRSDHWASILILRVQYNKPLSSKTLDTFCFTLSRFFFTFRTIRGTAVMSPLGSTQTDLCLLLPLFGLFWVSNERNKIKPKLGEKHYYYE